MAVARSIATRLIEGLQRDLLADADVASGGRWNGRALLAPLYGNDASLVIPQIGLIYAPTVFDAGTSGVADVPFNIVVTLFEKYTRDPVPLGGLSAVDYAVHIQKIIAQGTTVLGNQNPAKPGLIWDPDNVTLTDAMGWLNNSVATFKEAPRATVLNPADGKPMAIAYSFQATFITRLDNVTRVRA